MLSNTQIDRFIAAVNHVGDGLNNIALAIIYTADKRLDVDTEKLLDKMGVPRREV